MSNASRGSRCDLIPGVGSAASLSSDQYSRFCIRERGIAYGVASGTCKIVLPFASFTISSRTAVPAYGFELSTSKAMVLRRFDQVFAVETEKKEYLE